MTNTFSAIKVVILMFSYIRCQCGDLTAQTGKTIDAQMNCSMFSIEEIAKELKLLGSQTKMCNYKLATLTKKLTQVCKAVENVGKPEVDVTRSNESSQTIRVDVSEGFGTCVDRLRGHCSDLNAKIWCLRVGLWRISQFNSTLDDLAEQRLFGINLNTETNDDDSLQRYRRGTRRLKRIAPKDITRPKTGFRTRKEYRTLTPGERNRYHTAVQELYKDKTFTCFARVHRKGIQNKGVHRGEAFLPWHRAFLALYEEALRQIDPDVSLPYWDSTIDDKMISPAMSVMWDEEHMGTGSGEVDNGPFAGFVTDSSPLKREIGNGKGKLMTQEKIDAILTECRMGDMFKKLEGVHNGVHQWVGGTMKGSLSASDPIFYMHHAFIDLIWEDFRERQNSSECGFIDPGDDYPVFDGTGETRQTPEGHMPDEEMDGMEFMLNKLGKENFWTKNWYNYDDRPSCANNCGNSEDMVCDEEDGVCVSRQVVDSGRMEDIQDENRLKMASFMDGPAISCRENPYHWSCPGSPPLRRIEDKASAFVNRELPMPVQVAKIDEMIQKLRDRVYDTPPVSEPVFFREVIQNDCRTINTAVYDIVMAMLKGKNIPSKDSYKNLQ